MLHEFIREASESFTEARKNAYQINIIRRAGKCLFMLYLELLKQIVQVSDNPCLAGLIWEECT